MIQLMKDVVSSFLHSAAGIPSPLLWKSRWCHQKRSPGCRYSQAIRSSVDPSSRLLSQAAIQYSPRNSNDIPCSPITLLTHTKHLMSILLWSRRNRSSQLIFICSSNKPRDLKYIYYFKGKFTHRDFFLSFWKLGERHSLWGQTLKKRGEKERAELNNTWSLEKI